MADDLVKELRASYDPNDAVPMQVCLDAANRIERLETALREVLSLGTWGANILARCIMFEALETKCEQLKEGA